MQKINETKVIRKIKSKHFGSLILKKNIKCLLEAITI
jgi:hypothetical protein